MNSLALFPISITFFAFTPYTQTYLRKSDGGSLRKEWNNDENGPDQLGLETRKKIEKEFHDVYSKSGPIKWLHGFPNQYCKPDSKTQINKEKLKLITMNFTVIEVHLISCEYSLDQSTLLLDGKETTNKNGADELTGISFWADTPAEKAHSKEDSIGTRELYEVRELGKEYKEHEGSFAIFGRLYYTI